MRLISLYINKFGCLSNYRMNLDDNLTVDFADNGKGKSTIAAFIKAMFYGLDNPKKDKLVDRTHYAPLNNESFGGTIILEHKHIIYRIERSFNYKSASKDVVKVFDQNNHEIRFDEELGDFFFGIDKESYERTAFIGSEDLLTKATISINKKLNNLVANVQDDYDFEDIIEKLDDGIKKYDYPTGKINKGIYQKCQDKIIALQEKIDQLKAIESTMSTHYDNLSINDKSIKELENKINEVQAQNNIKKDWEHYDSLLENINKLKRQLQEESDKYSFGLPIKKELDDLEHNIDTFNTTKTRLNSISYNQKDKEKHEYLKNKYPNIPSKEDIANLENIKQENKELEIKLSSLVFNEDKHNKLNSLKTKFENKTIDQDVISNLDNKVNKLETYNIINKSNNRMSNEEIKRINRMFDGNLPSEEKIKEIENMVNEYQVNNEKINNLHSIKRNATPLIVNFAFSILFLTATITFLLLDMNLFAYISLGLIVVSLISLLIIFVTNKNKSGQNEWKYKEENIEIAKKLREFFASFMISGDEFTTNMYRLENDIKAYKNYLNSDNKASDELMEDLTNYLSKQFSMFGYANDNYKVALEQLKNDYRDYLSLSNDYKEYEMKREMYTNSLNTNNITIKNILEKYNIFIIDINELNNILIELNELIRLNTSFADLMSNNKKDQIDYELSSENIKKFRLQYHVDGDLKAFINAANASLTIIESLKANILDKEKETKQFKNEKNLGNRIINSDLSIEELNKSLQNLIVERDSLKQTISDNEEKLAMLNEYEENIEDIQKEMEQAKIRAKLVKRALEYMKKADENLKNKFVLPIKDKYIEYAKQINPLLAVNISMNYEFEVNFDVNGKYKNYLQLSLGEKACLGLCLRFAIIDNIYKNDKPIIILDDPFVNLDEENLKRAKSVLTKLSKDTQILYFCCHKSRMIED